ncbi:hypothetical protein TIFTF001_014327 [Ficus carica]|uniref:RNase H type-1 domain-containing protein n=1 Tax=Ficus carica TaxID=3494 RepID=A0AA87ZWK8_FICCA|nr:hypothetical protein TIFTF001_014327 [Ficus carica]
MLLDQILRNSGSQMKIGKMKKSAEKSYDSLTRSRQLKRQRKLKEPLRTLDITFLPLFFILRVPLYPLPPPLAVLVTVGNTKDRCRSGIVAIASMKRSSSLSSSPPPARSTSLTPFRGRNCVFFSDYSSTRGDCCCSDAWSPSQSGYLKLNIDASVFPSSDHIGIGAAIRDDKGSILGAVAKSVEGSFSPFVAECLAIREGLRFVKEIECANIKVETDAINVVSAVVDNRELSMEGPILEDVKQLLAQLRSTGIHHIGRSANYVAHLLARFGFNSNCTYVWISETPSVVSNAVSIDAIA